MPWQRARPCCFGHLAELDVRAHRYLQAVPTSAELAFGDVLGYYRRWPEPTAIIVDGPYGVGGFPGDPPTTRDLARWYLPHAAAWAEKAMPQTTLWFWGTELSWATVHPALDAAGWDYRTAHVWNKGLAHVAGNVNGKTIRRFPIATEVCVQYVRRVELQTGDGRTLGIKDWLRAEWLRTGLPLNRTNGAAGVKNAATRKYFTQCHLWYFPPPEMMEKIASYAQRHGTPTSWPYFSLDGESLLTAESWERMRAKWHHEHGITNVWGAPPVHGKERVKDDSGRYVHANQKPVALMERMIRASTDPGDVVWDPFAGLATAAIAASRLDRRYYGAELDERAHAAAVHRLKNEGIAVKITRQGVRRRDRTSAKSIRRTRSAHRGDAVGRATVGA